MASSCRAACASPTEPGAGRPSRPRRSWTTEPWARLTYGDTATIWRINLGWRRRRNRDQHGFLIDLDRGVWQRNEDDDGDRDDPDATPRDRIIPYVEDSRNALLVHPTRRLELEEMASFAAALKHAVQRRYHLEDAELAVESLPDDADRRMLLLYEASEGGAGVLRRLVEEPDAFAGVVRTALEVCHYDPDTCVDRGGTSGPDGSAGPDGSGGERCEAACYDCLLSYRNQPDHRILDRQAARDVLAPLRRARVQPSKNARRRVDALVASGLEGEWLDHVRAAGYREPDDAQVLIEAAGTRPDFVYLDDHVAVYVDGRTMTIPSASSVTQSRPPRCATSVGRSLDSGTATTGQASSVPTGACSVRDGNERHRGRSSPCTPARAGSREAPVSFAVGSLVRTRGREWVVLPETDDELVMVRPLGGTDAEVTGILTDLEKVEPATFAPPDPELPGDHRSAQLLRDALVLGFRDSAGPFRSVGHLAVTPRPYQLVPLLMALRQDIVRLLIADDVGIGKTIEAALIARELLDQGDIARTCVLCPPHLAEQWQAELAEKFHIDAQLVLTSTAAALERQLPMGRTIFEEHPHVVVSIDFIKSDSRRDEFVRTCPEFVIVDEAHVCADAGSTRRHQRYELVRRLSENPERHLVLVTATPHSGKEDPFRSLLRLLARSSPTPGVARRRGEPSSP